MNEDTVTLDREAAQLIRRALVVGLSSYGELERLRRYIDGIESMGGAVAHDAKPMHPAGSEDPIDDLANALAYLNDV